MGCLKLYEGKENKGTLIEMSKADKNKDKDKNKENKQNTPEQTTSVELATVLEQMKELTDKIEGMQQFQQDPQPNKISWKSIIGTIIASLVVTLIANGIVFYGDMRVLKEDVAKLNDMNIDTRLTALETKMDILLTSASTDSDAIMVAFNGDTLPFMGTVNDSINEMTAPTWNDTDVIATDMNTGIQYTAENLANKRILAPYTLGNQEVIFYGQFNENNNWNGDCIINVYVKNELVLVMDAIYDNGELQSYKQVLKETTSSNEDVWIISERIHESNENIGETWTYVRDYNYPQVFAFDDVEEENVIRADDFSANINTQLISYYNGNTSDGMYNDDSGNAYLVKYNKDGTVKLLYVGKFVDGYCTDTTGEAFSIAYSEEYSAYFYNTGNFKNGNATHHSTDPLTIDEVKDLIKDYSFACKLNWKE